MVASTRYVSSQWRSLHGLACCWQQSLRNLNFKKGWRLWYQAAPYRGCVNGSTAASNRKTQWSDSPRADQTTANAQHKPALAESALAYCHHIPISPDVYLPQPSITQCSVPISVLPCLHWTRDAPFPVHSVYHWPTLWLPLPSYTSPPQRHSLQISGRGGGPIDRTRYSKRQQRVLDRQAHQAAHTCCSS